MKGCFGGSGRDLLCKLEVCEELLKLVDKDAKDVVVVYLGTATYDADGAKENQTCRFVEAGCQVLSLDVAWDPIPSAEEIENTLSRADIVVVSGGNTLYAVDTWKKLNIDLHLRAAMERGAVLSGGSAGAICWFDGGHSDSMDPTSYKQNFKAGSSDSWEYIRVEALGFLPGLLCPHHNRTQSNGVPRAEDFDQMLLRHSGERGIGIDHFAVLLVEGEEYRVISYDGDSGVWIKEVVEEKVVCTRAPQTGKVSDLLVPAKFITQDPRVEICRAENV
jgi:dipeptidase E